MIPTHILVGTDFSEGSDAALDAALTLAKRFDARISVVHVHDPMVLLPAPGDGERASLDRLVNVERDLKAALGRLKEERLADVPGAEVELIVRSSPPQAMREHAERVGADLIVVSTHGRTGLKHLLIGSVAERTVRLARCPVLVVPT